VGKKLYYTDKEERDGAGEEKTVLASGWRRISEGYSRATISLSTNPRRTI